MFNLWLSWVAWSWLSHVIKGQSQEFLPHVGDIVSSPTEQGTTALLEVMAYKTNYLTSLVLTLKFGPRVYLGVHRKARSKEGLLR